MKFIGMSIVVIIWVSMVIWAFQWDVQNSTIPAPWEVKSFDTNGSNEMNCCKSTLLDPKLLVQPQ